MTGHARRPWIRVLEHTLRPDPQRVVALVFLPGQELSGGASRSSEVLRRILRMTEPDIARELEQLTISYGPRHWDLEATWRKHWSLVEHRVTQAEGALTAERQQLVGACFTQEYGLEGAALFNPSMVRHPDQSGLEPGALRFVMTLRAVGEGHVSSVEMRTGAIDAHGQVDLDQSTTVTSRAVPLEQGWSRQAFREQLADLGGDRDNSDFVLDLLPDVFDRADLDRALESLRDQQVTRGRARLTLDRIERVAASSYAVEFPAESTVQQRVLMPQGPAERRGMEDVRMLSFAGSRGEPRYLGTYTAYDGTQVASHLLSTDDFRRFTVTPLIGPGARNKGLALFPRTVGGRYLALSRADRENNSVSRSDDLLRWDTPTLVEEPHEPWEVVQLGNCGPPVETDEGWLVLTHGVGPMREYSIGALLLDLDDPTVVRGRLTRPLLGPDRLDRSGYVPNVVYSCGALLHAGSLVIPFGCNDTTTRIAVLPLAPLLSELLSPPGDAPDRHTKDTA